MKEIRAYISYDYRTGTRYYKDFEVVEKLPEINEIYYEDDSRIEKVKCINEKEIDCEQGKEEFYN